VPGITPVTTPPLLIVAIVGAALVHVPVPLPEASLNVVVDPSHTLSAPVIGTTDGITFTDVVA
jgi:hypothetical protein